MIYYYYFGAHEGRGNKSATGSNGPGSQCTLIKNIIKYKKKIIIWSLLYIMHNSGMGVLEITNVG